jgi:DUF1680 family protein
MATSAGFALAAAKVTVIEGALAGGENAFYAGNRAPLMPSPLVKLPVGAIQPQGWARTQLKLMADGFTGHLSELTPWCNLAKSAWKDPAKGGHGWEEAPYWLKGYVDLGLILKNERILKESKQWLDATLATQQDDGFFGPLSNKEANDLWPNMIMLYPLRSWHEATGDERIIPFMTRYFKWVASIPVDQLFEQKVNRGWWQRIRAADNLDSIYWLYNRTGEKWLLDLAEVNHARTYDWTEGMPSWHGVNICESFRGPAQFYMQSKDPKHLKGSLRVYDTVWGMYGQVPGGMFGADENCREGYTGPRQAAETCSMVEVMHSHEHMTRITGEVLWADRCEEVAHNSLPAAMMPDLKGLHYLTAPNQIQLCQKNKSPMIQNGGDMFSYSPHKYRCCQHNVAFGWPYFTEHLWMATKDNGLAAVLYAASKVNAKVGEGTEVTITETTDYPFDDVITFELSTEKPVAFPLLLRVPGWCEGAKVQVNGKAVEAQASAGSWIELARTWKKGDTVKLRLPMVVRTKVWANNHNAVSVHRGPLTYSLKIKERWQQYGDNKDWPMWEVYPDSPWNYGLIVDTNNAAASIRVFERLGALADQPFTPNTAPIFLKVKGKRIPQWTQELNGLVGKIQDSPVRSNQPVEDIVLIPMGCARLRISAFPQIGEGDSAHTWAQPPKYQISASHSHNNLGAVIDGALPKKSDDTSIPRFTWWDHKGTGEWVQLDFSAPQQLSWCEVYWFDDTGRGHCRVPLSWKLLYHENNEWKQAEATSEFGTKKDTFNRVTFKPIETRSLRIWAELQPKYSGGILECRVGKE